MSEIGADLNLYDDPGPWGDIAIGPLLMVAAVLVEVDGARKPEEWKVQKGTGTKGATLTWRGTQLAEKLKLKFRVVDDAGFQEMTDLGRIFRPILGQKPATVPVINGFVNGGGIYRIVLEEPAEPKYDHRTGATDYEWGCKEYAPSQTTDVGIAGGPTKDPADPPTQQSAADKEIASLLAEAKRVSG